MQAKKLELNGGTETHAKPEKKRRIAIVGSASSSRMDAPFDDNTWEIWTLGCGVEFCPRIDKLFEMHTRNVLESADSWNGLFPFLQKHGDKVILGHENPLLPDAKMYPLDSMVKKYGRYFTSSIAYMLAYAIEQNPEAIGLWGVDMMGDEEYVRQRACCEYYLGIAREKNIVLALADESPLLRAERLYGFEHTDLSAGINIMRKELAAAIKGMEDNERKARDEKKYYEGQMAAVTNIWKRYG